MRRFRILSIDGGGIRGVIPAVVLAHIEELTGKPISSLFDLIAGTSTGGIIALGLVKPRNDGTPQYSAVDLAGLYESQGTKIFRRTSWRRIRALGNLAFAKYGTSGLEEVLEEYFGDTMLSEAITDVTIPSYDIEMRLPIYFTSYFSKHRQGFNHKMRKVAQATASAPTYFRPLRLGTMSEVGHLSLVDGGVFANNPSLAAFSEARGNWRFRNDDLVILSLGTGKGAEPIHLKRAKDWGLAGWAPRILDVVMDSVSESVHHQIFYLLRGSRGQENYLRLQPWLEKPARSMDNASQGNIKSLRSVADDLVKSKRAEIERICELIA